MVDLQKYDIVYYVRILPLLDIYNLIECVVRTVKDDYFVILDKRDKQAYLLDNPSYNTIVFKDRDVALNKVLEAEKDKSPMLYKIE